MWAASQLLCRRRWSATTSASGAPSWMWSAHLVPSILPRRPSLAVVLGERHAYRPLLAFLTPTCLGSAVLPQGPGAQPAQELLLRHFRNPAGLSPLSLSRASIAKPTAGPCMRCACAAVRLCIICWMLSMGCNEQRCSTEAALCGMHGCVLCWKLGGCGQQRFLTEGLGMPPGGREGGGAEQP